MTIDDPGLSRRDLLRGRILRRVVEDATKSNEAVAGGRLRHITGGKKAQIGEKGKRWAGEDSKPRRGFGLAHQFTEKKDVDASASQKV